VRTAAALSCSGGSGRKCATLSGPTVNLRVMRRR
jgi:hypothetical protein